MTAKLPDRQALRAHYDAAVTEVNATRDKIDLTKGFYAKTGDGVFEAGYLAISDFCNGSKAPHRLHVVSAPAGGGKTSFSYALMMAITRLAESNPDAPYGCVLVVDQIAKADEAYKELNALMPGKVAVWTTEHDRRCKVRTKIEVPAAVFDRDALRMYPVVIVTHSFYNGAKGNKAHQIVRDGRHSSGRALVIVDERPEEVDIYETTLKEAQTIRERLSELRPDLNKTMDDLMRVIMKCSFSKPANTILRPTVEFGADVIAKTLEWFTSKQAADVVSSLGRDIAGLDQLFGFARALTAGCAFAVPSEYVVRFVGWQRKLLVYPGTLLLDATADIDGVTQVCPWREHIEVPKGNYANLEIVHVPQHTKERTSTYLKKAANQRAYVDWMVATIKEHMSPGEKGLVVCKKVLFDQERIPPRPNGEEDPFALPESYQRNYAWEIDGRKLCAVHYGTGIGSNAWQNADVVFLFDEFHLPRRTAAAATQGLRNHRADQGDLGSMTTLNSKATGVDAIADGHRMRWTKQMALRGKGRTYDEHGNCGKQRLVVSSDLKSFSASVETLFPGAKVRIVGKPEGSPWADKVLAVLAKIDPVITTVKTKDLAQDLGKPWNAISSNVLTPKFRSALRGIGWTYVSCRGRKGSTFVRTQEEHTPDCEPQGIHSFDTTPIGMALSAAGR